MRGSWQWTINAPEWKCPGKDLLVFSATNKIFLRRFVTTEETWVHYYTPDKTAVKLMGTCWVTTTKETKRSTVGRKGPGFSFLGSGGHSADRLPSHWPSNYWEILRKPPRPNTEKIHEKRPVLQSKNVISSGQRPPAHRCNCYGTNPWTEVRIVT